MTFTRSQFLIFCSWSDLNILTWRSVGCRFIYAFLGAGAITCFVSLTGHIAAELSNGFCLSCVSYSNVSNASCDAERKGSCVDLGTCHCALWTKLDINLIMEHKVESSSLSRVVPDDWVQQKVLFLNIGAVFGAASFATTSTICSGWSPFLRSALAGGEQRHISFSGVTVML